MYAPQRPKPNTPPWRNSVDRVNVTLLKPDTQKVKVRIALVTQANECHSRCLSPGRIFAGLFSKRNARGACKNGDDHDERSSFQ